MHWLAEQLSVHVADEHWPELVRAATFDSMRGRASRLIPGAPGVLKEPEAFFRRGSPGAGREVLSHEETAAYERRVAAMAPRDLNAWLDYGRG